MLVQLVSLGQVILINIALSGDNAIVVGMAASGVEAEDRRKVIFWGIGAAVILRVLFAAAATWLMDIIGLTLAGGILLLWVSWKLYREIRAQARERRAVEELAANGASPADQVAAAARKTVSQAVWQVALADVSMSLDNVIAVAGASRDHPTIMVIGLLLSVALMGVAANYIARLLQRFHWLAYLGLAVIAYVALDMIWRGGGEVLTALHYPA